MIFADWEAEEVIYPDVWGASTNQNLLLSTGGKWVLWWWRHCQIPISHWLINWPSLSVTWIASTKASKVYHHYNEQVFTFIDLLEFWNCATNYSALGSETHRCLLGLLLGCSDFMLSKSRDPSRDSMPAVTIESWICWAPTWHSPIYYFD